MFTSEVRAAWFLPGDRWLVVTVTDGIVPGDSNGWLDAAWYDSWSGTYALAVTGAGGAPTNGTTMPGSVRAHSTDGRFVCLESTASNLGPPDTNALSDVYLVDRQTSTVARMSLGPGGSEPNGDSFAVGISDDARLVLFDSEADNLLPGDTNDSRNVFVRDLAAGSVELIDVTLAGGFPAVGSWGRFFSADGRFVLFESEADDLVPGDTNSSNDLFLRDRRSATTVRVNLGPGGVEGNRGVDWSTMTPDARWIAFDSAATNLHPASNGMSEIFLLERPIGILSIESLGSGGLPSDGSSFHPSLSDDGRFLTFRSTTSGFDPGDVDGTYDQFRRDRLTNVTRLISKSTGGAYGSPPSGWAQFVNPGVISPSGRLPMFQSNLQGLVAGDTNHDDWFVWDAASTCPPIESYCTAKANSPGCPLLPTISSGGEPYTSGPSDAFFISAHHLRTAEPGLFIWSRSQAALPFYGGTLCVAPPIVRTPAQNSGGYPQGCSGTFSFHFSQAYMLAKGIGPGTTVYGQFWKRDGGYAPPNNVGLTDGIRFTTAP